MFKHLIGYPEDPTELWLVHGSPGETFEEFEERDGRERNLMYRFQGRPPYSGDTIR